MNILLTGAFGNVGIYTLKNLIETGHSVRIFELDNKKNRKMLKSLCSLYTGKKIDVVWGDITDFSCLKDAVAGQDLIIHQAFVIPSLSEEKPNWSWEINVEGTRNLLKAARELAPLCRIVFTSSVSVFGNTQDFSPPRNAEENVRPTDNYSHHKVACEQLVKISGLKWTILRLGAVLSPSLCEIDPMLFNVPLDNRIELIHAADAGYAIAKAAVSNSSWGEAFLIGGGSKCQMLQKDFIKKVLDTMGIGMLPDGAFTTAPFYTDWMDTGRSQELLDYQKRDLDDFLEDIKRSLGVRRHLIKIIKPVVKYWLLKKSPYLYKKDIREKAPGEYLKKRPVPAAKI